MDSTLSSKVFSRSGVAPRHHLVLVSLPIFFSLHPYIGLPILPSDIQPLAISFCVLAIFVRAFSHSLALPKLILPALIMLVLALVSFFVELILVQEKPLLHMVRHLVGYVTPVVILTYIYMFQDILFSRETTKLIDFCLFFAFIGFLLQMLGLNSIIQIFINRAVFDGLVGSARGLTGFNPEQSRVSEQLLLFGILYSSLGSLTRGRIALLLIGGALSFAGQYLASVFQVLLGVVVASLCYFAYKPKLFLRITFYIGSAAFFFTVILPLVLPNLLELMSRWGLPGRFIGLANLYLDNGVLGLLTDKNAAIKLSGLVAAAATILYKPFNFQLSAEASDVFVQGIEQYAIFVTSNLYGGQTYFSVERVYSALGVWVVHFGVFGLFLSFWLLIKGFTMLGNAKAKKLSELTCFFILLQLLFLKIPLANPTLWFAFGVLTLGSSYKRKRATFKCSSNLGKNL